MATRTIADYDRFQRQPGRKRLVSYPRRIRSVVSVVSRALTIPIILLGGAYPATAAPYAADQLKQKYGLFVHYAWGGSSNTITTNRDGTSPKNLQDLADRFDAPGFAADVALMGVEYVIFTLYHADMNVLYRSAKMDLWFPGLDKTSNRDVIRDLIDALKPKGIRLYLYIHPDDGHDFTNAEKTDVGFDDATNGYKRYNDFMNDIWAEMCARYGGDVSGYWVDHAPNGRIDTKRLRQTIKSCDSTKLLMSCNMPTDFYDLYSMEGEGEPDWGAVNGHIAQVMGQWWWPDAYGSTPQNRYSAGFMLRQTVLQASVSPGMGVAWAVGPYASGGWENNVKETLQKLGALIAPIAASIKGAYPSAAFPSLSYEGITYSQVARAVATRSPDSSIEFIHVLKPPVGATIDLPVPKNGKRFSSAAMLRSGVAAQISQDGGGVHITIPEKWDSLDTVIRLTSSATPTITGREKSNAGQAPVVGGGGFCLFDLRGRMLTEVTDRHISTKINGPNQRRFVVSGGLIIRRETTSGSASSTVIPAAH